MWVKLYSRRRDCGCRYSKVSDNKFIPITQAHFIISNSFHNNFYKDHHHFHYICNQIKHHLESIEYSRPDITQARAKLAILSFETFRLL